MPNQIKVSILVPVYKAENYIKACFDSILAQDYPGPLECIFVDDCGGDKSIPIIHGEIEKYESNIDFRIIYHESNKGVATSRNTLIKNATGDYFFFLDADDELRPCCISKLVEQTEEQKYDLVLGNHVVVGVRQPIPSLLFEKKTILNKCEISSSFAQERWPVFPHNKLCRRQFIIDNELYFKDGIIHEDILWSFMLSCTAKSMCVIPTITYNYYMRDHSITSPDNNVVRWESYEIVWAEMNKYMVDHQQVNHNTLSYLNTYLIYILGYKVGAFKEFAKAYKKLRKLHLIPATEHIKTNGRTIKYQLKDLHYYFPWFISLFWEYQIVKRLK